MATAKRELATQLAEACPLEDGSIYRVSDVERILNVLGEVLALQLAQADVSSVEVPGVCVIRKVAQGPSKTGLGHIKPTWRISAAMRKGFRHIVKKNCPPPAGYEE